MVKTPKLEKYGARNMPLLRSPNMTDAEWNAATLEFDDTMRRMGKRITWQTKFKRCPQCGIDDLKNPKTRFGAMSGLCMKCSDASVADTMRMYGIKP
jgi:hypothetical protein